MSLNVYVTTNTYQANKILIDLRLKIKHNLEEITFNFAFENYKNILKKVVTVASYGTNY